MLRSWWPRPGWQGLGNLASTSAITDSIGRGEGALPSPRPPPTFRLVNSRRTLASSAAAACVALAAILAPAAHANCQLGGTFCGDPVAIDCNGGVVCFPPFRSCSGCACTTTNEGKTCLANASEPGSIVILMVTKSVPAPGSLDLTWSPSCTGAGRDYSVHEGQIGSWYSHEARLCTTGGALAATLVPFAGDRYYLVAPTMSDFTGSLGTSSAGTERPDSLSSCTSDRALAPCP